MITVSNIVQSSEGELICITYQLLLEDINNAVQSTGEERKVLVTKAKEKLMVLTENLNLEVDLAKDLFKLYIYIQNILINHWKDNTKLEEVSQLVKVILKSYQHIKDLDVTSKPMMQNTQPIYAGMTYGKGYLEEQTWDDQGRGFKA